MNIQRFIAPTAREALDKARAVFGDHTLILSNRPTPGGVEVMATAEDALGQLDQGSQTSPGCPCRPSPCPPAGAAIEAKKYGPSRGMS